MISHGQNIETKVFFLGICLVIYFINPIYCAQACYTFNWMWGIMFEVCVMWLGGISDNYSG